MTQDLAFKLVSAYVEGWRHNNLNQILGALSDDCLIIESHGPCYRGIKAIQHWVALWLQAQGQVLHWDILHFYFLENEMAAFFEWHFTCRVHQKNYELDGISKVQFTHDKINVIHEYRMTQKAYEWDQLTLQSE